MLHIKDGNLLDATEQYICHQCNCTSQYAAGLANGMFYKYPYADDYARKEWGEPGTIKIHGDGKEKRFIINMFAQVYPGPAQDGFKSKDTKPRRETYFEMCLEQILKIPSLESIAFPFMIGCGLAGGDWKAYWVMLEEFAKKLPFDVIVYRLK